MAEQWPHSVLMVRGTAEIEITVTPTWAGVLDFNTRFPSALMA
jgi:hypothetical protein